MGLLIKGVTKFIKLTDAPASYAGQSKKSARVNAAENALEFGSPALGFAQFYNGGAPTDLPWAYESPLPWTPSGTYVFPSPIMQIGGYKQVYILGRDTSFWRYNLDTKAFTKLASPTYNVGTSGTIDRKPVPSPDGAMLACVSEALGDYKGGRRIEFYNIAANTWSASSQVPDMNNGGGTPVTTCITGIVWMADNDTLWAWASRYITGLKTIARCIRYVKSTDTWTIFPTLLSGLTYADACAGGKNADESVIFGSQVGGATARSYQKYTIATDSYSEATIAVNKYWAYGHQDDKLWFFASPTYRQGYLLISDESQHDNQFVENTARTAGLGHIFGLTSDMANIITHARSAEPRLMSVYGTGMWKLAQQTLTQRALLLVDKPNDGFPVYASKEASFISLPAYQSTALESGTWDFYYSKAGNYSLIKLYYCLLEGG